MQDQFSCANILKNASYVACEKVWICWGRKLCWKFSIFRNTPTFTLLWKFALQNLFSMSQKKNLYVKKGITKYFSIRHIFFWKNVCEYEKKYKAYFDNTLKFMLLINIFLLNLNIVVLIKKMNQSVIFINTNSTTRIISII